MNTKSIVALLLSALMAIGLCACSGKDNTETEAIGEDGLYPSISAAVAVEIQNLLPTNGNGNPKSMFYWNIYETLFDFNADLELVPDLAKGYEIVDDTHWKISLFETIQDSAGNHITASDVAASVDWLISVGEALNYTFFDSVEALDDYTLLYTWTQKPTSTSDIEFPLTRTFIFSQAAFDSTAFSTNPVATGNYTVKEFTTGSKLVLVYNPNYWADVTSEDVSQRLALHKATVKELTYEIIQESATAQIALKKGDVDYCDYIRSTSLSEFEGSDQYTVDVSYSSDYSFLAFNMDPVSILSNDLDLRLAVCYALDSDKIAEALPGSYTAMKTYGTPYFSDYDASWETDGNYCTVSDTAKAKEYLANSGYAAAGSPALVLICKSTEADQNAAQMMMAQLINVGINVELKPVDASTFQTDTGSAGNFDLMFFNPMSGKNLVSSWKLACSNIGNKRSDGTEGCSLAWVNDAELFKLYETANADDTHTSENMKAVIDRVFENAYIYPVAYSVTARIYNKNHISQLYFREGNVTLAASAYVGQTLNADPVTEKKQAEAVDYSAIAGEYTFSEAVGEGSGVCEYKLTLQADGSYRLDQHNMYNEDVFLEGTFTCDGETVVCAAPDGGVQGSMDRLLNSGWTDADAPSASWTLNGDGTAVPVGYTPAEAEVSAETAAPSAAVKTPAVEIPADYHRFMFYEAYEGDYTQWQLYVNDTSYILALLLPNGMEFDYTGEKTQDGPVITMGAPNEADNPKIGDFWNEDGTVSWQILGGDDCVPVKYADMAAYAEGVSNGTMGYAYFEALAAEAEKEAEASACDFVLPEGYEEFIWNEGGEYNTEWHFCKDSNGNYLIHGDIAAFEGGLTFTGTYTEDKGLVTCSAPNEADNPKIGGFWAADGTCQWQITGAGACEPKLV